jgi:hypothetical protein
MAESANPNAIDGADTFTIASGPSAGAEHRALPPERVRELLDLIGAAPEEVGRALGLGEGALYDCLVRGAPRPVAYALLGLAVASRRVTPAHARRLLLRESDPHAR